MSFAGPAGKRGEKGLGVLRGRARGWSEGGESPSRVGALAGGERGEAGRVTTGPVRQSVGSRAPGLGQARDDGQRWERVGWLGVGIAIGTVLGAGIALLYAPQSGLQTRAAIRHRGRAIATRGRDAWDELAEELGKVARRRMKKMRRKATRAQWAAEDWREERGW